MGEKDCQHEWEVSPMVLDFNPPIYHRTCARCGAVQERHGYINDAIAEMFPTTWRPALGPLEADES